MIIVKIILFPLFFFFGFYPREIPKQFRIEIHKAERKLFLYQSGSLIKTYKIALGLSPIGKKTKRGDYKTPEGDYYIISKNPHSSFYLALGISYPNIHDAEAGLKASIISRNEFRSIRLANERHKTPPQNTALGGEIFLHGNGTMRDWTWGCVAMEDSDVKELFDEIPVGTAVTIEP
jgi:murein L,D-transpeptidase YafK